MTAAIEIYTRPGCGYCSAAKSLLNRKKATFTEYDVRQGPDGAPENVRPCWRGDDLSADLHWRNPCRRLRRALCAGPRRQARRHAGGRESLFMSADNIFTAAMVQMRTGAPAGAEPRAGHQADPRGGGAGRRLRADARSQQHDAAEPQGAVRASRERRGRSVAEGLSRAREGTEDPSAYRLAGAALLAGEGSQPLVPDRARRHDPRLLRQDPHVRHRSAGRRELPRIRQLPAGRDRRHFRPAVGPDRA